MTSTVQQVIDKLEGLRYEDNDHCVADLYDVLDDFRSIPNREIAIPTMFAIIERYPEADLGAPGPLVHEIEAVVGYEAELEASLARNPTHQTCSMVNSILNAETDVAVRLRWIVALRKVASNESASRNARDAAQEYLEFQGEDA